MQPSEVSYSVYPDEIILKILKFIDLDIDLWKKLRIINNQWRYVSIDTKILRKIVPKFSPSYSPGMIKILGGEEVFIKIPLLDHKISIDAIQPQNVPFPIMRGTACLKEDTNGDSIPIIIIKYSYNSKKFLEILINSYKAHWQAMQKADILSKAILRKIYTESGYKSKKLDDENVVYFERTSPAHNPLLWFHLGEFISKKILTVGQEAFLLENEFSPNHSL